MSARLRRITAGIAAAFLIAGSVLGLAAAHELPAAAPTEVQGPMPQAGQMFPAAGNGLFTKSAVALDQTRAAQKSGFIKRWRLANIDSDYRDRMIAGAIVEKSAKGKIQTFKLPLFDDATVTLYKTGMRRDSLGSTIWTGRVVNAGDGEATFVIRDGRIGGTVRVGKHVFIVEPTAQGGAKITETDPDLRPHIDPLHAPAPSAAEQSAPSLPAATAPAVQASGAPTVINVLVAYTPAAATSVTDIQSAISMGISYTNQVLSNSGINTQINLAGVMQVDYAENGKLAADVLNDAVNGVGGFSAAHTQRDAVGADLVSVWTKFADACGIAYQLDDADVNPTASEAPYGYNAISLSFGYACLTDGVAHEIGHNMGAGHDRYVDDPQDLLTSRYNFGYVDTSAEIRTIMSYPDACNAVRITCAIVPYHSSPSLTYLGRPLGIADSAPNAADNVRRINEIAPYIALFRAGGISSHTLTVSSTGQGTVTSSPSGITCGTTCSAPFAVGATVTLTATPTNGATFTGWSGGGCSGTGTCSVVMSADVTVTANFGAPPGKHTLTIAVAGSVTGQVISSPPGLVGCSATCNLIFAEGTSISLAAGLPGGVSFAGWGGACSGSNPCTVTLNADVTVIANFIPTPVTKTLSTGILGVSTGGGTITAASVGINCGFSCRATLPPGTVVTLTANAGNGSEFAGWSGGGCSGTGSCTVTLYTDTFVGAIFRSLNQKALTIAISGPGNVLDGIGRITCGDDVGNMCTGYYAPGSEVEIYAKPESGVSVFTGWPAGLCNSTDSINGAYFCTLTLSADTTANANFRLVSTFDALTISSAGVAGGSVQPCSLLPCTVLEEPGSQITLTASPAFGYIFTGWSGGGCTGTSSCTVTMNGPVSVAATFSFDPANSSLLTITKTGTGTGTLLTQSSGAINCGTVCSARVVNGSNQILNAIPAAGSVFNGWNLPSSCRTSTSLCNFVATSDTTVSADFKFIGTRNLSVATAGSGAGVITTGPAAISCGVTCSAGFTVGTQVTLLASANQGSLFLGWSGGGCSGTFPCTVIMNADTNVVATFLDATKTSMLSVVKTGTGGGTVNSTPSGIACGSTCNASYPQSLPITLTATADKGSTFVGWNGGGCSGNQTCATAMTADTQITANFAVDSQTSITLVAATLPSSRSVQMGSSATLFGTIINAGPGTATYCGVSPALSLPTGFSFQTTAAATNGSIGAPNTPVDIPSGGAQSFVLTFTPTAPFGPIDVPFTFSCTNAKPAANYTGVNTLQLSSSLTPVPDVVAVAGTVSKDGTLYIPGSNAAAAFVVAVSNVGAAGQISAIADTGGANLPVTLSLCQTDPVSGACLSPPSATVSNTINGSATASFGIFASARAAVPFLPAVNRIFVRFIDPANIVRGSTSVAVRTQ